MSRVLTQRDLEAGNGLGLLVELLTEDELRASMGRMARSLLPFDATQRIAGDLRGLLGGQISRAQSPAESAEVT